MEVETEKAVEGQLDIIATDVEDTLNEKNLRFKKVSLIALYKGAETPPDSANNQIEMNGGACAL